MATVNRITERVKTAVRKHTCVTALDNW